MHPEIDQLELPDLVDRLDDLETRRTPVGWEPDDAVLRSAIERRIMQIVGSDPPSGERRANLRLPCDLEVKLRSEQRSARGRTRDLGVGGVFVETSQQFGVGTVVELEVRGSGTEEHGLRVRGHVSWIGADEDADAEGVGVSFSHDANDRNERRLRRFVIELLRHRSDL